MNYQKFVIMFLFLSVQAYCMQKGDQFADKLLVRLVVDTSVENYKYNKTFFQNKMIYDAQPRLMSNLDHLSNIQFIRTSKHLYEKYVQKTLLGGIKYNDCLFTTIPFDFDYQTRALFHYAPQHYKHVDTLLAIEDSGGCRAEMLKKVGITDVSDTAKVMDFYQQRFSDSQITMITNSLLLFKDMLRKGLCCHTAGQTMKFFNNIIYKNSHEWDEYLSRFLRCSSFDPNERGSNGRTILTSAIENGFMRTAKVLLVNSAISRDTIQDACDWAIFRKKTEAIRMLLAFIDLEQYGAGLIDSCRIYDSYEALKIILAYPEIDPNKKSMHGFRPLYLAAALSNIEIVKILLADERVDPSIGGPFSTAYSAAKSPAIRDLLSERTPLYKKYPFVSLIVAVVLAKIMWDYFVRFI